MKANANKNKFDVVEVAQTPVDYLEALEADISADWTARGKKLLKTGDDGMSLPK